MSGDPADPHAVWWLFTELNREKVRKLSAYNFAELVLYPDESFFKMLKR